MSSRHAHQQPTAFTLIELLAVIIILTLLISILLPLLSRTRRAAMFPKLIQSVSGGPARAMVEPDLAGSPTLRANIKSFDATISLTPRLSVGTADPESIYEARFTANILATRPAAADGECELELPLPPQIISLADLSMTAAGEPSESVTLRDGKLLWHGRLTDAATPLSFTYTAVGKGLYILDIPPGSILDSFKIDLTANDSDVRMLELSLQPSKLSRGKAATTYTWDYKHLLLGRPIQLDVLGIAPIDRLGEISWLGPESLVVFGLIVGLVAYAYRITRFDRWTLLLVLGTFAGVYPLMYFAQEFVSLPIAIAASCFIVLLIIAVRSFTAMPVYLALGGIVLPAGVLLALTLVAAVHPNLQGILLTAEALAFFVFAMTLMPKLHLHLPLPTPSPATA